MTRKKVKLSWIVNDNARKTSLRKRKAGLTKKVCEIHTLCAVSTFIIIFSPGDIEPMIWPALPAIQTIIVHYQSFPKMEQTKKNMNQEGYIKERLKRVQDQTKKIQFKCKQAGASYLMHQMDRGKNVDDFTNVGLQGLIWFMEMRMKDYRERNYYLEQIVHPYDEQALPVPASVVTTSNPRSPFYPLATELTQYIGYGRAQMMVGFPFDVFKHDSDGGARPSGGGGQMSLPFNVNNTWPNNQYFP